MPDKNIGRIIGCYELTSVSDKRSEDGRVYYNCKCIFCGYEAQLQLKSLHGIKDKCVHYKTVGEVKVPYCKYFTPWTVDSLRVIFTYMVERCYNIESKDYKYYGARGITICQEWLEAPWEFEKWALNHGYKKGLTIDRIDGSKGYEPLNCQWVTRSYNGRYTSRTRTLTATITLSYEQWSELLGEKTTFIKEMCKKKGVRYSTEYIEEKLLNKKVLAKRQDNIKKQAQKKLIREEMKRQKELAKKNNTNCITNNSVENK